MPNYQKGKIYKLYSPSSNLVYYGSTTQLLSTRLAKHIFCFNNKETYKYNNSAFLVIEKQDYKMELVKHFPCNNKQQLCIEEGNYIKNNECVNKYIAGRTAEEYKEYSKNYNKKYYELNTEYYKNYFKNYYQEHKQQND
jgi:fructose-1,6-bisphosphatase